MSTSPPHIPPPARAEALFLRAGLAFVWLATGVGVLHPEYRRLGAESLAPLGLPPWVMVVACVGEIALGLRVLFGRMDAWLAWLQAVLIAGFTAILTATQPGLWLHPFGVLTKNLALLGIIAVLRRFDHRGWDVRCEWRLRAGLAVVWLADGFAAQFLYGLSGSELAPVRAVIPLDPALTVRVLGVLSGASGLAALIFRGRTRQAVLLVQLAVLAAAPVIASFVDPLLWAHPFGPLTKNVPLVIGTWIVCRGVPPSSGPGGPVK
jgi:hypothetical protein